MEEIKLYTIADLRGWIFNGKQKDGLSEAIITSTRAYSFINNPYAIDDMPVVSALFVNNDLAAYTAAFPEKLLKPNCITHWFNSLYVDPKYEGKGYALIVIGSLMERYGKDPIFDLDAVPTSVEILSYMGLQSATFAQYDFRNKSIQRNSIKGYLAHTYDTCFQYCSRHRTIDTLQKEIASATYTVKYDNFIDYNTFHFIEQHAQSDAFLRTKESLNWMLHNPFVHEAPLLNRVNIENLFTSSKEWQKYYVVKVYQHNELAGVYILCDSSTRLNLLYLYYDTTKQKIVLLSIAEHILKLNNNRFATTNSIVANFVVENKLYPISKTTDTSICYPAEYASVCHELIQGGDGDMFLN